MRPLLAALLLVLSAHAADACSSFDGADRESYAVARDLCAADPGHAFARVNVKLWDFTTEERRVDVYIILGTVPAARRASPFFAQALRKDRDPSVPVRVTFIRWPADIVIGSWVIGADGVVR